jgi:hypothetical protein
LLDGCAFQEEKRLMGLSAPDVPKKKRRKKVPDVNAPPPDTAQHAIYVSSPSDVALSILLVVDVLTMSSACAWYTEIKE